MNRIDLNTPPKKVLNMIAKKREKSGEVGEKLILINQAIEVAQDYIVNLFFEKAHIFQLAYMQERDKVGKLWDVEKQKYALKNMEKYVKEADEYIKENELDRWLSRIYRYLGRVSDYRGEYTDAMKHYKKALTCWKKDPEVVQFKVPRWLELEGFLANSLMAAGEIKEGLKKAKLIYGKYDNTKDGINLKRNDYTTWAIWKSGIPIHALQKLIESGVKFNRIKYLEWLADAEIIFIRPRGTTVWADFGFRKKEIEALKRKLKELKFH